MPQGYERVSANDDVDSPTSPVANPQTSFSHTNPPPQLSQQIPNSPPPSFRSRASSPTGSHHLMSPTADPYATDAERTLADTFDDADSEDEEGDGMDDRQRLMRASPSSPSDDGEDHGLNRNSDEVRPRGIERRVTQLPVFNPTQASAGGAATGGRIYGGGQNDGVFANLSAKPTRGEELEEKPPTYEQAALDATPPYWETTILTPGGPFSDSNAVYIEGLPVGSVFSFVWNAMISMSFQLVGFLLTYLLHTTHAAKNGSRAGLGITLIQYGFSMKGAGPITDGNGNGGQGDGDFNGAPPDPNSHDFDPNTVAPSIPTPSSVSAAGGITTSDWIAYLLMVIGWFILIKSISDFVKARRHEQLVLQSPERGLGTAVVAEGESPSQAV
ncbi:hypothetical protein BU16DRAFT_570226 [Lophium mytilinum]|uniref:Metal homeostatis protein bsd2 n=1 Tax=Lophium mytilinum TaxID=390894 RepID=A0A6A6RA94_9PEZI|nr:hypothetical protein BU16DRAFT_570226 [Lophium mytilinum]